VAKNKTRITTETPQPPLVSNNELILKTTIHHILITIYLVI
jgi:hypothetical protein